MPPPLVLHCATTRNHMSDELTNLLPDERRRALRRDYFLRLGTVSALLVAGLTIAASMLLLPTYIFLMESSRAKTAHLANAKTTHASEDEASLSKRLTALANDAATLTALANVPPASSIIRSVLAIPRFGIALTGFAYTPALPTLPSQSTSTAQKNKGKLAITGVATTRNALRAYQLALQAAPLVLSADLPVSAYAKDVNSVFTITLILAL